LDEKKKWERLTKRYNRREEANQTINVEQKEWEDSQIDRASQYNFGSRKQTPKKENENNLNNEDLGYVFEDQVEFIKEEIMQGNISEDDALPEKTQAETLQEVVKVFLFLYTEKIF